MTALLTTGRVRSARCVAVVMLAFVLLTAASAASAASVYTYQGAPLTNCTPGPATGTCYNWGPSLTGTLTFDESIVTETFTGAVAWNSGAWLSSAMTLATVGTTSNLARAPGDFVFENGRLVGWDLVPQFTLRPPLFYLVNVFSAPTGDRVSPVTGSLQLGLVASNGGGTWSRTAASPVPLPAAAWLLIGALSFLGAAARRADPEPRSDVGDRSARLA